MKATALSLLLPALMLSVGIAAPVLATQADQLPVARVSQSPTGYYQVDVPGTEAGQTITCTLVNAAGQPIASNSWASRAPETSVPIRHTGDDVQTAVCTRN